MERISSGVALKARVPERREDCFRGKIKGKKELKILRKPHVLSCPNEPPPQLCKSERVRIGYLATSTQLKGLGNITQEGY